MLACLGFDRAEGQDVANGLAEKGARMTFQQPRLPLWPADKIERLRRDAAQGLSAGQIEILWADGTTRNAIIGKCARMGIQLLGNNWRPATSKDCAFREQQRAPKKRLGRQLPLKPGAQAASAALIDLPKPPPEPAPQIDLSMFGPLDGAPTAILSLTRFSCRFPIGEPSSPDFRFCGALEADMAVDPPRPYCPACKARLKARAATGRVQSAETIAKRKQSMARRKAGQWVAA